MERYELVSPLGEGAFGQVFRANCRKTGKPVAIKLVKNFDESEQASIKVVREI